MTILTVTSASPLLQFLFEALAPQSRSKIKGLLSNSRISVNGKVSTAFDLQLQPGDEIRILDKAAVISETKERIWNKRLNIKYEDEYLIVLDKPEGLPTISTGRENETTAYSLLTSYIRETGKGERIFIVHRLDRETSGLLVFAKDSITKELLQSDWNETVLERKYSAVVKGYMEKSEGRLTGWLTENPKSLKINVSPIDNGGKKAITNYKVEAQKNGFTLLSIELETGRKNQIRAQLAAAGHPVAGDRKYTGEHFPKGAASRRAVAGSAGPRFPFPRLALHATTLCFRHPRTGEILRLTSPSPFRSYFDTDRG